MIYILIFMVHLVLIQLLANAGNKREIGYNSAFWLTVILGPIVGAIGVGLSRRLPEDKCEDVHPSKIWINWMILSVIITVTVVYVVALLR